MTHKLPLADFHEATYNPRKISDENLNRLKASIVSHTTSLKGWQADQGLRLIDPVIVNTVNKRLIGGHQRVRAIKELGQDWLHRNDVRWVTIEDQGREVALNIALNNQSMAGEYDIPKLKDVVTEFLNTGELDLLPFTGFSQPELDDMFGYSGRPESRTLDPEPPTEDGCFYIAIRFRDEDQYSHIRQMFGMGKDQKAIDSDVVKLEAL